MDDGSVDSTLRIMGALDEYLDEFVHQHAGILSLARGNGIGRGVKNRHGLKRLAAGAEATTATWMIAPILDLQRIDADQDILPT